MASVGSASLGMVSPAIFEQLQTKLDEDSQVREELRNLVQSMEKQGTSFASILRPGNLSNVWPDRTTMSILSRAHSISQAER
jgi:hypothetical protein